MSADAPRPNATTAERMAHVAEQLDEIERWLAGLANEEAMTIGRIPERLGRTRSTRRRRPRLGEGRPARVDRLRQGAKSYATDLPSDVWRCRQRCILRRSRPRPLP